MHCSISACHLCAEARLIFSVSVQSKGQRKISRAPGASPSGLLLHRKSDLTKQPGFRVSEGQGFGAHTSGSVLFSESLLSLSARRDDGTEAKAPARQNSASLLLPNDCKESMPMAR